MITETLLWCVSQPHESLPKRHHPFPKSLLFRFSKIHILKLWTSPKDPQHLVSKYPKSFHIWFPWHSPNLHNKLVKVWLSLNSVFRSCQIVSRFLPFVPQFLSKQTPIYKPKSCHGFSKSCHGDFAEIQTSNFESKLNIYNNSQTLSH